jgi:hypothetical protein
MGGLRRNNPINELIRESESLQEREWKEVPDRLDKSSGSASTSLCRAIRKATLWKTACRIFAVLSI